MRRPARLIALLPLLLLLGLVAGCGSSSDSTSSSSSTSSTTSGSTVEGDLQAKLDDATQACKDSAGQISNSTVRSAAEAACDQLNSSLSKQIAADAEQAKGNVSQALDDLASQCRQAAGSLPSSGQDVVNSFCDAISASSSSVSSGG